MQSMAKNSYFTGSAASRIDRELERLIGKLQDPREDRATLIAQINELSSRRTRLMRPRSAKRYRNMYEQSPLRDYVSVRRKAVEELLAVKPVAQAV